MSTEVYIPGRVKMSFIPDEPIAEIRHDIAQHNRSYDRSQATIDKAHSKLEFLQKRVAELERLLNENVAARDEARLHRDYYQDACRLALTHLGSWMVSSDASMDGLMKAHRILRDAIETAPAMQEDF